MAAGRGLHAAAATGASRSCCRRCWPRWARCGAWSISGKRLWTRRVGLYAGYALLFALQFTYQAKKAQIDPLVVFWITLANYGLLRHLLRGPDWTMWMLGWFAAGMGTITKGVGGLALLMLAAGRHRRRCAAGARDGLHVRDCARSGSVRSLFVLAAVRCGWCRW